MATDAAVATSCIRIMIVMDAFIELLTDRASDAGF